MSTSEQETLELNDVASPVERKLWMFGLMWFGQLVSGIGSGLTSFALGVWVYEQTGSAAKFTFIAFLGALPSLILLPIAGALVDRWDKRWTMLLSDTGSAVAILSMLLLTVSGSLRIWHIYCCVIWLSISGTFGLLAYYPAITLSVPKRLLGRVSGMTYASQATAQIASPLLGGLMIALLGLKTIFVTDFVTFLFSITTLALIRIPKVQAQGGDKVRPSIIKEAIYGWTYIKERSSLLLLLFYFASTNFVLTIALALFAPMILSAGTPQLLGTLNSISGVGLLTGSLVMSAWGGPRDRIQGVLGFGLLVAGGLILTGLRPQVLIIAPAVFAIYFAIPIVNGCSQALWQCKTAPELQGRVFSLRRMIATSMAPLSFLLAGRLSDHLFEPMLAKGGLLSDSVGRILGVGPGRGIGSIFVLAGIFTIVIQIVAFRLPTLRLAESLLPDAISD
ncbi:MAG: MFS transporter [Candidatus Sulfotelmatobacter sp.]